MGVKQEVPALLTQAERLFYAGSNSLISQNNLVLLYVRSGSLTSHLCDDEHCLV